MIDYSDLLLVGYDLPLGQVPAPATPIFRDSSGNLFAAFASRGSCENKIERVCGERKFTPIRDKSVIDGFNPTHHSLYLIEEEKIIRYKNIEEQRVFQELLRDSSFAANNPVFRLSLAKITGDRELVRKEINTCTAYMAKQEDSLDRLMIWYPTCICELENLVSSITAEVLEFKQIASDLKQELIQLKHEQREERKRHAEELARTKQPSKPIMLERPKPYPKLKQVETMADAKAEPTLEDLQAKYSRKR